MAPGSVASSDTSSSASSASSASAEGSSRPSGSEKPGALLRLCRRGGLRNFDNEEYVIFHLGRIQPPPSLLLWCFCPQGRNDSSLGSLCFLPRGEGVLRTRPGHVFGCLGLARGAIRAPRRHPPVLRMVLEALQAGERRRGTSVAAIKVYILQKYPTVDALRLNHLLKQALATGLHRGLLIRPVNSKAKGATGSFKLVPKDKRKIPPRKTALRMPSQAEGKDPKKPSESKKDPANPGEVKKGARKPREGRAAPSKPGAAKNAPKKGMQTKDPEARLGEAKKSSQRPDKAAQAPPSASGPGGKLKVKERGSRQDTKAHRKTQPASQSSKPTVTKGENGTSLAKKKMGGKVPKEAAGEGPKAKAPVPPKGAGSKKEPVPLAGKAEASKGPRKPGIPTKSSVSKAASKKAEAEG